MTIPSTPRKAGPYTGNGVQTAFPFAFKVFSGSDVEVRLVQPGGDEVLVAPESYTVSLNSNQETSPGGTVTYPLVGAPIASGARLAVVGAIDYDQPLDLPSGGNFSPLALENQLDRTVMQVQQLAEQQGRALTLPVTSSGVVSAALPSPEASALLAWNSSATALENVNANSAAFTVAYTDCAFDTFTGDGTQTVFSLSKPPANIANLDLSVDGQTYVPGVDYTLSSNLLAFTTAPIAGAQILARYGQVPGQLPVDVLNAVRGPFLILDNTVTYDFSVPTGKNALSISPTISPGVTVTVPPGSEFVTLDEYLEAGEVNTASNLSGAGEGIFASKSGVDLQFKRLRAGLGVTLTADATGITVASTSGEVNTASNVGAGAGVFASKVGVDLRFKSLTAGPNVSVVAGTDSVQISSSTNQAANYAWTGAHAYVPPGLAAGPDVVDDYGFNIRYTSPTGGSPGFVRTGMAVECRTQASTTAFEWATVFRLENYATAGENAANYCQAYKYAAGPTWAGVFEAKDFHSTGTLYGLEIDVFANGTASPGSARFIVGGVIGNNDGLKSTIDYGYAVHPLGLNRSTAQVVAALDVAADLTDSAVRIWNGATAPAVVDIRAAGAIGSLVKLASANSVWQSNAAAPTVYVGRLKVIVDGVVYYIPVTGN